MPFFILSFSLNNTECTSISVVSSTPLLAHSPSGTWPLPLSPSHTHLQTHLQSNSLPFTTSIYSTVQGCTSTIKMRKSQSFFLLYTVCVLSIPEENSGMPYRVVAH